MPIPSNLTPAQVFSSQFINTVNVTLENWNKIITSGSIAPSGSNRPSFTAAEISSSLGSSYTVIQAVIAAGSN